MNKATKLPLLGTAALLITASLCVSPIKTEASPAPLPFPQVSSVEVAKLKAIDAKDLAAANKMIGAQGAFHGTVSSVYSPHGGKLVILDFDKNYRTALTAVVKPEVAAKFPSMQTLTGKPVLVSGKFVDYHGHPEIDLSDPSQVKMIK